MPERERSLTVSKFKKDIFFSLQEKKKKKNSVNHHRNIWNWKER